MRNYFFLLLMLSLFLQGCASSNVSREAADNVDVGYHNALVKAANLGNGSIADTYQNTSQRTKGLIIGGIAGAAAGSMSSGIGIIPGLAVGAIFGGAYGAYIDANSTFSDQLENRGVKMIMIGDQVMIVIQSNRLFNYMTGEIRPGAYPILDGVAKYIDMYPSMTVKVSAYTDAVNPERVNLALSREQSENVSRYLWRKGVNTRILTTEGMGSVDQVSPFDSGWDSGYNYRVQVSLEKVPL